MGAAPPWGQSLLRSCLAAHSFPPPPPAYVLSAFGTSEIPIRVTPTLLDLAAFNDHIGTWERRIGSELRRHNAGEAPSRGGRGRAGVRSAARSDQRLDPRSRRPPN